MSLTPREKNSKKPYNDSNIRWKQVSVFHTGGLSIGSRFYEHTWNVGVKHEAKPGAMFAMPEDIGFHVWVDKANAFKHCLNPRCEIVIKVEVSGFNCSGDFCGASETWKYAKVLAVYNSKGKNITYRFKPKKKK